MEIENHSISFQSTHSSHEKHTRRETLTFATPTRRTTVNRNSDGEGNTEVHRSVQHIEPDRVEISEKGKQAAESEKRADGRFEMTTKQKMELDIIRAAFGHLLEGQFREMDPEIFLDKLENAYEQDDEKNATDTEQTDHQGQGISSTEGANSHEADYGFSYSYQERHVESEKLTFLAEGTIQTADGENISFSMDLNISRSFFRETSVEIQGGNQKLIDPLVVNYEGTSAELSKRHFSFDINMDGVEERISTLKPGSGFLALDRNGNGTIDHGGELFGPETGRGFRELAHHDSDRNRFIDEGDPVYDRLMLLTSDLSGGQKLISLEEAGVGAIFLGSGDTEFSYKDSADNQLQGQLKRTGVFVGDDGDVGSVQEIELAARPTNGSIDQSG